MTDNVTKMVPVSIITLRNYVRNALETFDNDPADSDFQVGYEMALEDIQTILMTGKVPDA
ncbi:MAG: hypothetical protein Tp1125DCM00d2C21254131_10 [Prokaryotic dsDNA virus sp.]|nr:MAG: hypothetical protein Tp1125DCM00d2C21254131_10 [Prokaryotic dsDNA virus sp.]|tara:strand:- start:56 stop:235 length:180 start_codon:yes stop_codon:yes gene_type:complete